VLNGMFSPAMQVQPKPKVATDLPLIRKVQQKKDLGNCFLSPLLFWSTEGGTRTHTLLPELDFESSASAIPPLRLAKPLFPPLFQSKASSSERPLGYQASKPQSLWQSISR
jgi:hypothetical protein